MFQLRSQFCCPKCQYCTHITIQQITLLFALFILFKGKSISPSLKKEIFHRGGYYTSHLAFILIHLVFFFFFFLRKFSKSSF
jgi:hypothetical protein